MPTITVRYFASMREQLGSQETLNVPAGTTLAGLREQLIASSPQHAQALRRDRALRCALNQSLVIDDKLVVEQGAEVAFFPPVTGG